MTPLWRLEDDRRHRDSVVFVATPSALEYGHPASLVVLALLTLVVALGTSFVAATESGKGLRGRRLAQANPVPDLHLVADDITDVDASNLVQSWSDHTGNGLSLSSFVAAPELVDGGNISTGALFNGHKAVRFGESASPV